MVIKASLEANLKLYTILWCELDLRKQLIHNIRAHSKVKLSSQEVGMGVRNAATHYIAGLTTSLLHVRLLLLLVGVLVNLSHTLLVSHPYPCSALIFFLSLDIFLS